MIDPRSNYWARCYAIVGAVVLLAGVWPSQSALGQDLTMDIPERRHRMHEEMNKATSKLEAAVRKDPSFYKPDGSINKDHPAYKEYQTKAAEIAKRYNANDTRFKDFVDACQKAGVPEGLKNSGGVPKTINSDSDFSEVSKGAGKKVMDHLAKKGIGVTDLPDRWVIQKWDSTIWKTPGKEIPGSSAHQAQEALNGWADDIFSTQGGKFRTSNGQVGVKDAVGEVLANAKKFSEAVTPRDPASAGIMRPDLPDPKLQKVNSHIAGKSVAKIAEWSGVPADPKMVQQSKILRNHGSWEQAGVTKYGDPPAVKVAKINSYLDKVQEYMGRAMESARTQSADLAAKRAKLAETLQRGGMKGEAVKVMQNQIRANVSNEETLKYLAKTDPKLAGELSGMKVQANPDGTFTNKATGERMSPSQLQEAVTRTARGTTAEAMKTASERGMVKPGSPISNYGGKIIMGAAAVDGALKGAEQAVAEEKPGDSKAWTWSKATIYGIIHATGLPGAWEQGSEAGKESAEQFRKDLLAGKNPSAIWAVGRGMIYGVGGFAKGMTIDPLINGGKAVKEGIGAVREVPSAAWADRQSKKSLQAIREANEQRARDKEGAEARESRIILAENWVRMRGIPLATGLSAADSQDLKKTNPDEYNHRISLVLTQYDRLAEKLRRDGVLGPNKNISRTEIFNLLWHKYRGTPRQFHDAMAKQYATYGKKYVTVPTSDDLRGKWGGGNFTVKSTSFAANSGCSPEMQQEFEKLRNMPMPLGIDMQTNADGSGLMSLGVTTPNTMDKGLASKIATQKIPAVPFQYRDGKIVGELKQQNGTFKVDGELVRTDNGWALKGTWQMSMANEGRTVMLLKGDLSAAK